MTAMKFFSALCLVVLTVSGFFVACKKEDSENGSGCKATKVYMYDGGVREDSLIYFYAGSNVSKVQFISDGQYYTLEYNGNRVVKRNFFFSGSTTAPDYYETISYNPDGTPARIDGFVPGGTTPFNDIRIDFAYNAGKLSKITVSENDGSGFNKVEEHTYTFTGNNITTVTSTDLTTGEQSSTDFAYDTNNNYLTKQNPQFLFVDPLFAFAFDASLVPLAMSANNVTTVTSSLLPVPVPATYVLDDKGNVKEVKLLGQTLLEYAYFCS